MSEQLDDSRSRQAKYVEASSILSGLSEDDAACYFLTNGKEGISHEDMSSLARILSTNEQEVLNLAESLKSHGQFKYSLILRVALLHISSSNG